MLGSGGLADVVLARGTSGTLVAIKYLAGLCQPLWELRAGHRRTLPLWWTSVLPGTLDSPLIEPILGRLDEFAARWHALQAGGSITLSWPLDARPAGRREASGRAHGGDRCRPAARAL